VRTIDAGVDDGDANTSASRDAPRSINSVFGNPVLAITNLISVGGGNGRNDRDSHQQGEQQCTSA
jgi:hypothetical protein